MNKYLLRLVLEELICCSLSKQDQEELPENGEGHQHQGSLSARVAFPYPA